MKTAAKRYGDIIFIVSILLLLTIGCVTSEDRTKLALSANTSLLHKDYKVAVLNFSYKYSYRKSPLGQVESQLNAGEIVSKFIENELIDTKKFQVIDREHISKIISEHKLNLSGLTGGISTIGNLLNADGLLVGEVIELSTVKEVLSLKSTCVFTAKLIDVKTGTVIFTFKAEEEALFGNYLDALKKAAAKFKSEIEKNF
ncbi:MAG: hypothetical protein C0415_06405 [Thermodesulfovibrio sp.]|nr:hypothetical protein [Thermodesulfovibrio sp.]